MKKHRILELQSLRLLFFFFFFFSTLLSFSQEDPKIEKIDGGKFYIHTVEPGHTLYAISKKYLVEINAIIDENPEVKDGLKVGQTLKIPVVKENKKLHKVNNPEIEGNNILHQVEQGQTIYSLSKQYNVEVADLVNENPGIQNSMQIGQFIKIPVDKVKNVRPVNITPAEDDGLKRHTIAKGETLYSLSKLYEVAADSIIIINKGLTEGLKIGETILIPVKKDSAVEKIVQQTKTDSIYQYIKDKLKGLPGFDSLSGRKDVYQLALMLPLFLDENDVEETVKENIYPPSLIALEFYEGFLLALDSMKNRGMSVRLFVYDTNNDTSKINLLLNKPELKEMDIIIGPLYASAFNLVSKFASKNKIHIVSPFVQMNNIILNNPSVSKPSSSQTTQFEQMASYISDNFSKDKVLMVHNSAVKDKELVTVFSNSAKIAFDQPEMIKEVKYIIDGFNGLKNALSETKNNVIVVPSNDQAFVTELVTKLNFLKEEYKVTLFGIDSWLNFDNIDVNYLHKLQTHITTSNHIDFINDDVKVFIKLYRNKYYAEPSIYAFQGFDVGYYYLSSLHKHGVYFDADLNSCKHKGLQTSFNFNRLNPASGYENKNVSIIKYEDFKLIKVN